MNKNPKKILINLIFLIIGGFSLFGIRKHIDVTKTLETLTTLKIDIVILVVLATLSAYVLRVFRWMLLLNRHNKNIDFISTFSSLMYGYFVNLGIPRSGELTRAVAINKQTKSPFPFVLGTIIMERFVDLLSLGSLLIVYALFYSDILRLFFEEKVKSHLMNLPSLSFSLILISLLLFGIILFLALKKLPSFIRLQISSFVYGFRSIIDIPNKILFFILTIGIWVSYFFTSYICFFSVEHSYELSFTAGFSVLILGSIARSIPVQAGAVGVFHTAIISVLTLSFFGVDEQTAFTIALIIHAIQTLFQVIIGGGSAVYVGLSK